MRKQTFILKLITLALCSYLVSACDSLGRASQSPTPLPTPTVDITSARNAFETGGELTYSEIIALRRELVGDQPNSRDYKDTEAAHAADIDFQLKDYNFNWQLAKCKLKESLGWVSYWRSEYDKDYKEIPDLVRLYISMDDPYSPSDQSYSNAQMIIVKTINKEVTGITYGQRIRFSGELAIVDGNYAVKNATYNLLVDNFSPPTPGPDELKDLQITLNRTTCYGSCPDYTLTIAGDGKVTFEGRHYTRITGTATATLDQSRLTELVKEFQRADFFNLQDSYRSEATDNPTYTVSIQFGGQAKRVENYATGPRRLYLLEDRIDQIVNSDQWIK